ncbi:RNase H domain-containing protein [Trichonephila inaurata madagascariensis]|uniref:RNase H domain-containing protein n=1 Tax=Trichonephila inaurata madagascariensis TaxID=2747483 RepID=A0A8X6IHY2_9ARAC|nr:RNase H domain-containing protein [Trichonephila inaurata madagascariensis]
MTLKADARAPNGSLQAHQDSENLDSKIPRLRVLLAHVFRKGITSTEQSRSLGFFWKKADDLAKEGSDDLIDSSDLLTYNQIYSKFKTDNNRTWKAPPSHDPYQQNGPGAALELKGDKKLQTAFTRLISVHTRGLIFLQGQKTFPVCLKCNVHQASSEHLLSCIVPEKNFILENPAMVYDFLLVNGLLDLSSIVLSQVE